MKKDIILVVLVLFTSLVFAQNNLNDYKYVVVANKFDFLKNADQYQLNSLTKFLFNKYGFKAYKKEEELPKEAQINKCLILNADVLKKKGLFVTKLVVQLKNCNDSIVFTSAEGSSREKEYKVAFNEALRKAFNVFKALNYSYNEKGKGFLLTKVNIENDIKNKVESNVEIVALKKEIKTLKEANKKVIVPKVAEENNTKQQDLTPKSIDSKQNQLYAQAIDKGFQLVDKTPSVVYTIYNSGKNDVFIVKDQDAIIHKVKGVWTISIFKNNSLINKTLKIKF